jgi:hypothetical protein
MALASVRWRLLPLQSNELKNLITQNGMLKMDKNVARHGPEQREGDIGDMGHYR